MHSLGRTGNSTLLDSTAAGGTCLTIADDLKQILHLKTGSITFYSNSFVSPTQRFSNVFCRTYFLRF